MLNLGSFPKWLFHDGTKFKLEESESVANRELLQKSSEVQRQREYGKLAGNIGCVLVGVLLFISFTAGYVALTAKLSRHLWTPTLEYQEGGGKNWHRRAYSVRRSRLVGDVLPSITEHELPDISSHATEFHFRAESPRDEGHLPKEELVDPVRKLAHERPRRTVSQVAEGSMSAPWRPSRRIPILHRDRLSRRYEVFTGRPTDAFDDHDKVHR